MGQRAPRRPRSAVLDFRSSGTGRCASTPAVLTVSWMASRQDSRPSSTTWQPAIPESGVPTTAARLMTYALIAVGLWLGLESANLTLDQRRTTWLAVMVPF